MNRVVFNNLVIVALSISVTFSSCKKDNDDVKQMKLTFQSSGEKNIRLVGSGTANIDWGDDTESDMITLSSVSLDDVPNISRSFTGTTTRTITITGDNITGLGCWGNQLTHLDISKNTELAELSCWANQLKNLDVTRNTKLTFLVSSANQLTNLDVSKNTLLTYLSFENNRLTNLDLRNNSMLEYLECFNNQFTAAKLNDLFNTLHNITFAGEKLVYIGGNPGTEDCDKSIATNKGWTVENFYW